MHALQSFQAGVQGHFGPRHRDLGQRLRAGKSQACPVSTALAVEEHLRLCTPSRRACDLATECPAHTLNSRVHRPQKWLPPACLAYKTLPLCLHGSKGKHVVHGANTIDDRQQATLKPTLQAAVHANLYAQCSFMS